MQLYVRLARMFFVKINRLNFYLPLVLISLALIVSFNTFLTRLNYDRQRATTQFSILERDLIALQEEFGKDFHEVLAVLRDKSTLSSIIVQEHTISDYQTASKLTVLTGAHIINTLRVGQLYRTVLSKLRRKVSINPRSTYIVIDELKVYRRVLNYLKLRFPNESVIEYSGRIIQVNIPVQSVLDVTLGFNTDLMETYASYGFNIIPEFKFSTKVVEAKLDYTFSELEKNESVEAILFSENFNYGNAQQQKYLSVLIQNSNYKLLYPEFNDSPELVKISKLVTGQVARIHKIEDKETYHSFNKLYHRYMRALTERSPDVLVFKPIFPLEEDNLYEKNIVLMTKVIRSYVKSGGKNVDYFQTVQNISISYVQKGLIGLGIFSALYLLLLKVHRLKRFNYHIWLVLFLLGVYTGVMIFDQYIVPVFGLMAAVIGPVFALIYFFPEKDVVGVQQKYKIGYLFFYLLRVFCVCVCSVLFCVALYSDPVYLQQVVSFNGVKLALVLPAVLVGVYFYCGPRRVNSIYYVFRRLSYTYLTTNTMLLTVVMMMIVIIYLIRSGNYMQGLEVEHEFRAFLENVFFVRPRFKEMFVGYPALFLGFLFINRDTSRNILWIFNVLGVIALISFVNSFCHFHTPVLISLYRSMLGLILGGFFAILFYYIYYFFVRIVRSLSSIN
jgi:hypothetical protein